MSISPGYAASNRLWTAAIAALKADGRKRRQPSVVTPERVLQLEAELAEKTQALAELSVAYTLLEKKERVALRPRHQGSGSPRRNSK